MNESKRYKSVKEVTAVPMMEHDYLMSVLAQPGLTQSARNGFRQGYKVESDDGRTWFEPKEQFEKDYQEVVVNG